MTTIDTYHTTMSEADLQANVVYMAHRLGWRCFFLPDWLYRLAMASMKRQRRGDRSWQDAGFPDLVLLRWPDRPRLIIAELKSSRGKTRDDQDHWIAGMGACGIDVRVWRPEHWFDGSIEAALE